MLKRIEHIGIAVKDLEKSLKPYQDLGLPLNGVEEVMVQGAQNKVAFFPLGETETCLPCRETKIFITQCFLSLSNTPGSATTTTRSRQ